MRRFRTIERRVFAAFPLVAVALGWVAIWMAWPKAPMTGARRPHSMGVSLCRLPVAVGDAFRKPVLFGRPSSLGFHLAEEKDVEPSVLTYRQPMPPRLLRREETAGPAVADVAYSGGRNDVEDYVPVFESVNPFPAFSPEKGIHVTVLGGLAERRLKFPETPDALVDRKRGAWEVDLMICVTPEGRVANIMVKEASADAETLRLVEHFVFMATADIAAGETAGCVRVGYAKP